MTILEIREFEATRSRLRAMSQPFVLQIKHLFRQCSLDLFTRNRIEISIKVFLGLKFTNRLQTFTHCFRIMMVLQIMTIELKTVSDGHFNDS